MSNTELSGAAEAVRSKLDLAQDIARQTFEDPREETVMAVFHRLCVEADQFPAEAHQEVAYGPLH